MESVLNGYYTIVLQKQLLVAIKELLGVAEDQARLTQARAELGGASRLDQLQAVVTLNQDSSSLLVQQISLRQTKIQLNQLLARDPSTEFDVVDSIPLETNLPLAQWQSSLHDNNTSIQQATAQQDATASSLKEAKGLWWPSLNAGVAYSATPAALNPSTVPARDGATYSVNLSVPLFDQLRGHQAVSNARLEVRQGATRLKQTEENIRAEFEQDSQKYTSGLHRVDLETRNLEVAKLQAEAALERHKVGATTALELRDAQRLLLDARSRLIGAYQDTKQAEVALKRLAGLLVQPSTPTSLPSNVSGE